MQVVVDVHYSACERLVNGAEDEATLVITPGRVAAHVDDDRLAATDHVLERDRLALRILGFCPDNRQLPQVVQLVLNGRDNRCVRADALRGEQSVGERTNRSRKIHVTLICRIALIGGKFQRAVQKLLL